MDLRHAEHLKPGARIAVFMGATVAEIMGTPPIVTTATVVELDGDIVWTDADIAQGQTLPQMYRVKEDVIGFLMPMAEVTHHPDGSITGRVEGYIGP